MPPRGTEPSRKTNEGCKRIYRSLSPRCSQLLRQFWVVGRSVGGARDRGVGKERESELCSVCSVRVIHTAIMIDFVPLPTRTPLPFSIFFSQAQSQLWVRVHMLYVATNTLVLCLSELGQPWFGIKRERIYPAPLNQV